MFNKMPLHNVVSCTTIIFGHVKREQDQEALVVFQQMQQEGVWPSHITFIGVLNACASVATLDEGQHAHQQIIESGLSRVSLWGVASLTCMQNVGAWRRLRACPITCLHTMWSLGIL